MLQIAAAQFQNFVRDEEPLLQRHAGESMRENSRTRKRFPDSECIPKTIRCIQRTIPTNILNIWRICRAVYSAALTIEVFVAPALALLCWCAHQVNKSKSVALLAPPTKSDQAKRKMVVERNASPGASQVDGKAGRLGLSG